jgi:elongation factor P
LIAKIVLYGTFFVKFFNQAFSHAFKIFQKICSKMPNFFNQSKFRKKSIFATIVLIFKKKELYSMPQISSNDVRSGVKVEVEGQPYNVVSVEFVKPGKGQAFNRIRIKHLITGRVIERTYKSGDKMDLADVEETNMRMLYKESDGIVFMDETSFEQHKIPLDAIGDNMQWLKEDLVYDIVFYKGNPVTVEPPTFLELKITETAPGDRGNTASGRVLKPATLETGAKIQVPIFIEQDEVVKIDTRTGEYVSRV